MQERFLSNAKKSSAASGKARKKPKNHARMTIFLLRGAGGAFIMELRGSLPAQVSRIRDGIFHFNN